MTDEASGRDSHPRSGNNSKKLKELALRRDEPVVCAKCGKKIQRLMRGQKYCSRVCRERDRERCRKAKKQKLWAS